MFSMIINNVSFVLVIALPLMSLGAIAAEDKQISDDMTTLIKKTTDGYLLGSFIVQPEASVFSIYDSNIFATRKDEVEDEIIVISPSLHIGSAWGKHKLDFNLGGDFGRYQSYSSENYDDYWVNTDGRYDFNTNTNVFGGIGFSQEHEDRSSPENIQSGNNPVIIDSNLAHAGVTHNWGKTKLRFGGTYESLDYENTGLLTNRDRNRDMTGLGARLTYALHPQYSVYGQGVWDKRNYDMLMDDNGFQRDSDGYRANIGLLATLSNRLKAEAYIGVLNQDYDDPRFASTSAVDFGGNLKWLAAPRTEMTLKLDRSLEETTLAASSGYIYTSLSGGVTHKLTPRAHINASISIADADYQKVDRNDNYYSAQIGMRYHLSPSWYLGAEYRLLKHSTDIQSEINNPASTQNVNDFDQNQVFFTLGVLLYPVKPIAYWNKSSTNALSSTDTIWQGLYGGAQLSHDTLNLHTKGSRNAGFDVAQYSNSGVGAGLFAGYGLSWGRWYAGLEGGYDNSRANIYHNKSKSNSRTIDVDKDDSFLLALRGGYQLTTGPLVYARLGTARTQFSHYATINDSPAFADSDDHTQNGGVYGLGSDIPVNENVFVRLDYSYTDYDSFDVNVGNPAQSERFSPRENVFHLGLGWQFDGLGGKSQKQDINHTGLYAGAHLGHGAMQSDTTGTHYDGGSGPFSFSSDFGDNSASTAGVFLGYGATINNFYIGLEAELEDSNAKWDHERSPTGRNFSVEKMGTSGLSLRGGYVLRNGSLLYAHVGRARTRFNTTWVKGGNRLNDVDRDDTVTGTRVGVGAELPITQAVFLRLDYSYTDYDSYEFVTSHGNVDNMQFDNSESLFRLGLLVRF